MKNMKRVTLGLVLAGFLGCFGTVVADDDLQQQYERGQKALQEIIESRNKLLSEFNALRALREMEKAKLASIAANLQRIFPGDQADALSQTEKLIGAYNSLQGWIAHSGGGDSGSPETCSIVGNVQNLANHLQKYKEAMAALSTIVDVPDAPIENPEQVSQQLQSGIAALLDQNKEFVQNVARLQQQIEAAKQETEAAKMAHRETKIKLRDNIKDLKKQERVNNRLKDDNGALTGTITTLEDLSEKLKAELLELNKRFEEVSGYLIDLVTFAEENK